MSEPTHLQVVEPAPLVPAENLPALANEINETHAVAKSHAQLAVVFAVRTGILCERAKGALEHGKFGEWLEKNCPLISDRTAQKYMALVREFKNESGSFLKDGGKNESGSDLPVGQLTAPNFISRIENDATYRDTITTRVRDVVGQGSLTELYREYGVVHGPRNVDESTGKRKHYAPQKRSADEIAKELRKAAIKEIDTGIRNLENVLLKAKAYRHLTPAEIARVDDALGALSTKFHAVALKAADSAKAGKKGAGK